MISFPAGKYNILLNDLIFRKGTDLIPVTSIIYLIGGSVDSRQHLLNIKMASSSDCSVLHIVPTKGRVMELETDPIFWLRRRVTTLTGLIHKIFEENVKFEKYLDQHPIDDALRPLLIKKILDVRREGPDGLAYFNRFFGDRDPDTSPPGIYRAIASFFSKLVRNNYQDRLAQDLAGKIIRLEEQDPGMGEERYALESDLTWLFGDYEEIKREINGYDKDDILASVKLFLKDGGKPGILNSNNIVVFDGFTHLTRIEEDILFYLFQRVGQVWWLIDYDSRVKDPLMRFKQSCSVESTYKTRHGDQPTGSPAGGYGAYRIFRPMISLIARLEKNDFTFHTEKAHDTDLPDPVADGISVYRQGKWMSNNSLKIKSFPNRENEIRAIAGEIKRIIHDEGLDPSKDLGKIRVIFPDLNDYSSLIYEIFDEYGIPFSLTKGLPLISHPISNIFRYIFEVPMNRFHRDDIFRLFSSDLICEQFRKLPCNEGILPKIKEEYLLKEDNLKGVGEVIKKSLGDKNLNVLDLRQFDRIARVCGLDNLDNIFTESQDSCLLRAREYYHEKCSNAIGETTEFRMEYYGFLIQSELLEKRLRPFRDLTNLNNSHEIEESFLDITKDLGFPENIMNMSVSMNRSNPGTEMMMSKRDMKAYSTLIDLIRASQRELRVAQELFTLKGGYELLSRFYSIFLTRLNNAFIFDERNPNVVRISQWLETRGRAFDYIFSGGLTADRFPLRDEIDFILPDSPNKMFRMLDPIDQSRHLFAHVLKNYRKYLYFSFPLYSEEKVLSPSPMLTDLLSIIDPTDQSNNENIDLEEIFKWSENPYYTSKEELLNAFIVKGQRNSSGSSKTSHLKNIILKPDLPVEEFLKRVNADRSRNASDGLHEYDGLVGASKAFKEFFCEPKKFFSPSELDILANCPMLYQFEKIFELRPRQEIGLEVSPKEMGEHIHNVLSIFYRRLRDEDKNVSDIGLSSAFRLAREVAESYFAGYPFLEKFEYFLQQKREFLEGLDQEPVSNSAHNREGVFAQLLRFETREFQNRSPGGLEYFFGRNDKIPVFMGKTKIHGYIDRFDIDKDENDLVFIYDYKSGNTPHSSMIKKGLSFQLPAYMRALKSELGFKKISASFYSLKRNSLLEGSPLKEIILDNIDGKKGLDIKGVRLIDDFVDDLMKLLANGYFHHSTDEEKCRYCDFRYACHKEVRRINYLIDSSVDPLIYSGRKNLKRWESVDGHRKELRSIFISMNKAFDLKTESARKKHFESVINYKSKIIQTRDTFPFYVEYIDEILGEIGDFERRYISSFA